MATTEETTQAPPDEERCRARTESGDRCARPAQSGGYCFQHDESDPTVDDTDEETRKDSETTDESEQETEGGEEGSDEPSLGRDDGFMAIRDAAGAIAGEIINRELDGVIEVTTREDEWVAVVEVIERPAVPDTQDILGRYELRFADPDTITGYRRVDRYRRNDVSPHEIVE